MYIVIFNISKLKASFHCNANERICTKQYGSNNAIPIPRNHSSLYSDLSITRYIQLTLMSARGRWGLIAITRKLTSSIKDRRDSTKLW